MATKIRAKRESGLTAVRLKRDPPVSVVDVVLTLEENFPFQGKYYEQVHGVAMGSPISPLVANLFMAEFASKAISTALFHPDFWIRCVDDTLLSNRQNVTHTSFQHINSIDPHIQFTTEAPNSNGFISFLDTIVSPGSSSTLLTSVYRKPTQTDQYPIGTTTTTFLLSTVSLTA